MNDVFIQRLLELEEKYIREKGQRNAIVQKILKLLEEVWTDDIKTSESK